MDLDIEMDDVPDVPDVPPVPEAYTQEIITGEEQELGEIDETLDDKLDSAQQDDTKIIPEKIHIRGLDAFNPDDVKAYLAEHCGSAQFDRIEWIDDTSANIVFRSESSAQEVLVALAVVEIADATQLPPLEYLAAKGYAPKPECTLQVRFAVTGDKKVSGAAARSRFYLLHPEYDPEERRRRGEFNNSRRYRLRDGYGRRNERRTDDRYDDRDEEPFDVSLYDDDEEALAKRASRHSTVNRRSTVSRSRRDSASSRSSEPDRTRSYAQQNRDRELFPDKRISGGLSGRERSASPVRDRDSDEKVDLDDRSREVAAMRSREKARAIKERMLKDNQAKELFPEKSSRPKELFPTKLSSSGKAQMDQVDTTTILSSAKLAERISRPGAKPDANEFSIRGMASKQGPSQGFAIKGAGKTVKELFPDFGNAGKELFAEKLEGRGRRRQKAEDLFH